MSYVDILLPVIFLSWKLCMAYVMITFFLQMILISYATSPDSFVSKIFVRLDDSLTFDDPSKVTCYYSSLYWINPASYYWTTHCTMCQSEKLGSWPSAIRNTTFGVDLFGIVLLGLFILIRPFILCSIAGTVNSIYFVEQLKNNVIGWKWKAST